MQILLRLEVVAFEGDEDENIYARDINLEFVPSPGMFFYVCNLNDDQIWQPVGEVNIDIRLKTVEPRIVVDLVILNLEESGIKFEELNKCLLAESWERVL